MLQNKKFKDIAVFGILLILTIFFYKDIILLKDKLISYFGCDIYNGVFSSDYLVFGRGPGGKINLWNPYLLFGLPIVSHPSCALFYPLNIIFFLFPLHLAINYSFFLNTLLSGISIYLYIRYLGKDRFSSLTSAIIFMFCAIPLLHCYAGHLQILQTLPWLPLLFLFVEMFLRKGKLITVILAGIVLGIQILAGYSQYTFYTMLALTAYFLFFSFNEYREHKITKRIMFYALGYAVLIITGFSIAAVKLIPAMEFVKLSDRGVSDLAFAASWSFWPLNLVTYIFPEFCGDMITFPYWGPNSLLFWEMCGYVGILPLILGIIAITYDRNKYTLFFAGLSIAALLGALGAHTPFFKIFYYFLPGFSKFRGHSKMIILFAFSLSILSAYGLSWLLQIKHNQKKYFKRIVWSLGILAILAVSSTVLFNFNNQLALNWWMQLWKDNNWSVRFAQGALSCALFSLFKFSFLITSSFLLLFYWMNRKLSLKVFKFCIFTLIVFDLWLFGSKYIVSNEVKKCYWDRKIVHFLKEKGPLYDFRVASPHLNGPFPNNAILDGIYTVDGCDGIFLKRFLDLFYSFSAESVTEPYNLRLFKMANLKFLIMPQTEKLKNPALIPVYQTADTVIWQNLKFLPRAYIVHGAKVIEDEKERISYILFNEQFDPSGTVILETPVSLDGDKLNLAQQPGESVNFLKYNDDEVIIQTVLKSDGYLVLSDFNYPGWRVNILNLETGLTSYTRPLYANHLFRAVRLNSGKYELRFVFKPESFYLGLKITISAIVIIVALSLILLILKR